MKPPVNPNLTEVLPEDLVEHTLYLIDSSYNRFVDYKFKGIFLENIIDNTSDPPVIESHFQIQEWPQELAMHFSENDLKDAKEKFKNDNTRYYLAKADELMLAKVIEANTNRDVGKDLAKYFYEPEPKGGTKRKTKRTKRAKKGTKTKTKRTKRAKKGGTKTKRTT